MKYLPILLLVIVVACTTTHENYSENMQSKPESELKFDRDLWVVKEGRDYPHRDKMVNDIVYNDTIRSLSKAQILERLGEPSYYRTDSSFLYYRINESRLGPWVLHTKTMVVKTDGNTIEWIRIHQ